MRREGQDHERTCPRCGRDLQQGNGPAACASCDRTATPTLRVADDSGGSGHEPPPAVQLIREFKGPTADELLRSERRLARLQGLLRRVVRTVSTGDLERADARLDDALGRLHQGPGFRRRRWLRICRLLLWLLAAGLLALVLLRGL